MTNIVIKTVGDRFGKYECIISPKRSITVSRFSRHGGVEGEPNTFRIGDMAEYDSYNLSYYGPIVSITEKTVTIFDKIYNKNRRLNIETFAWRNHDFNLAKKSAENFETMHYI